MQGVRLRRNVKLALEGQRVFQRLHPREPSLEGFRNMAWRAVGVFFLVPDLEGRVLAHLEGAHCERLEVSIAFPGTLPQKTYAELIPAKKNCSCINK